MKSVKAWKFLKRNSFSDGAKFRVKMKQLQFMGIMFTVMLFVVYRTTYYQYRQTEMEAKLNPFDNTKELKFKSAKLKSLPRGIVQARSDMELRPLWSASSSSSKVSISSNRNLLAIPVGIKLKENVDAIVQKFLSGNFTVILFHYDGNVNDWRDLEWCDKAIHIAAQNQTKWWFAKRFLHPDVVAKYDYIFLWDEDLGVENFDPRRYLQIVKSEGFEISQPALDPNSTDIHHKFTIRARAKKFHRRVYDFRGSVKCTNVSEGPPCTGFVEGMAPVFSRSAWCCAWHLIQNDLVHGWGMDMKLGYCAQGDRTKNVGVIDSEYVVHQGIQTLGGQPPAKKGDRTKNVGVIDSEYVVHQGIQTLGVQLPAKKTAKPEELLQRHSSVDPRAEIRRQSTLELQIFKNRWNKAVEEDKAWVDPFRRKPKMQKRKTPVLII